MEAWSIAPVLHLRLLPEGLGSLQAQLLPYFVFKRPRERAPCEAQSSLAGCLAVRTEPLVLSVAIGQRMALCGGFELEPGKRGGRLDRGGLQGVGTGLTERLLSHLR